MRRGSTLRATVVAALASALVLAPAAVAQDGFVVTQKTTYNIARVGNGDLTETMMLRGNDRMKTRTEGRVRFLVFNRDASGTELIRLDEGQVYSIDERRRRYEARSLAQTRAEMERAQQQAQGAVSEPREEGDVRFTVVSDGFQRTGEKQTINGFPTEQGVLKLTVIAEDTKTGEKSPVFHLTADLWIDPGQQAIGRASHAFYENYVRQLGLDPRTAGNPYGRWLGDLYRDMARIDGYPIRTTITMEAAAEPQQAQAQEREQQQQAGAGDPVGAALGGMLRRARQSRERPAAEQQGSGRPVLFTSTTEVQSISLAAPDVAEFEVPAGFRRN